MLKSLVRDIGTVLEKTPQHLVVAFGERKVKFEQKDTQRIEPAYAITVHKSQGSEYPAVIIPVIQGHKFMLGRNLLYTAITRGKQKVILAGDPQTFKAGIRAAYKDFRYTMLSQVILRDKEDMGKELA